MDECDLFVKHDPKDPTHVSNNTKDVLNFILKNIDMINNRGHVVNTKLIDVNNPQDVEYLEDRGISCIPALISPAIKVPINGVEQIIAYLSRKPGRAKKATTDDNISEAVHELQEQILAEGDEDKPEDKEQADRAAMVAAEAARRGLGQGSKKPKTADEAIEETRKRKAGRSKKKVQFKKKDSDDEDDQPGDVQMKSDSRLAARRNEAEYNLDLSPAEIEHSIPATSGEDKRDKDLSEKFWAGRFSSSGVA